MTNREMETINNIIREKTYCDEEIPGSGSFTYQLYADYRDELDDANIKQIFNSCDPKEEFLDLLMQGYDDAMWETNRNRLYDYGKSRRNRCGTG